MENGGLEGRLNKQYEIKLVSQNAEIFQIRKQNEDWQKHSTIDKNIP